MSVRELWYWLVNVCTLDAGVCYWKCDAVIMATAFSNNFGTPRSTRVVLTHFERNKNRKNISANRSKGLRKRQPLTSGVCVRANLTDCLCFAFAKARLPLFAWGCVTGHRRTKVWIYERRAHELMQNAHRTLPPPKNYANYESKAAIKYTCMCDFVYTRSVHPTRERATVLRFRMHSILSKTPSTLWNNTLPSSCTPSTVVSLCVYESALTQCTNLTEKNSQPTK